MLCADLMTKLVGVVRLNLKPRIETIIRLRCGKCNCYLGKIPPPNCSRCNERIDDCNFVAPTPIRSGTLENFG